MHENPFEDYYLVIAEKPSVAMTIAATIGFHEKKDGYMESPDGIVSWCYGHLAELAPPEEYDERYRKWSLDTLPIIPENWKLAVSRDKEKQFRLLSGFLNNRNIGGKRFDYVINACDAGREGELIFNRVYELSGSTLPVKRLWISSMEDDAILQGFLNLRNSADYKNLAEASVCRAQADWLVGMNASRAFTKAYDYRLTIGRVQTPTLAMLVKRGEEISGFQKKQYFITHLLVDSMGHRIDAVSEHFEDREEANRLAGTCRGRTVTVPTIERQTKTVAPPKLYDLTSLQRDANRLFGLSASKTLACAQALYENKLITYPRTDSRFLTDDMEKTALDVISACRKVFPFLLEQDMTAGYGNFGSRGLAGTGAYTPPPAQPDVRRLLDSKKVSDHHAIIPTVMVRNADLSKCTAEQEKILILIAARLLCASGNRHVYESIRASFFCCGYTFTATGKSVKEEGWKAVDAAMRRHCHADPERETDGGSEPASGSSRGKSVQSASGKHTPTSSGKTEDSGEQDLSSLYQGARFTAADTKVTEHWTKPPAAYTEDTLLHAMETAGITETEKEVERKGLGTPATRAAIIDKLASSGYMVRDKSHLFATDSGKKLVDILPDYLKSAQMTADWENRLLEIERGKSDRSFFMGDIRQMVQRIVQDCRQISPEERARFGSCQPEKGGGERASIGKCPVCGKPVYEGEKVFYCSDRNCSFVLWKRNRYLDKMRTSLNDAMAKDLLEKGRTHARNLYSPGKDKYYSADLVMEWVDNRASYRLEFPNGRTSKENK